MQLDALIIDGSTHDFGAVGGVTRIKNPITLARKIMEETPHCFFVGPGADRMAEKLGIHLITNEELHTAAMRDFYQAKRTDGPSDTVGAIAMDSKGNVAEAATTSGTPYKQAGRVGDSPIYGAGGYAENGIGVAGATGQGENIMRVLLSKYSCDKMRDGMTARESAVASIQYIDGVIDVSMALSCLRISIFDRRGQLRTFTGQNLELWLVEESMPLYRKG